MPKKKLVSYSGSNKMISVCENQNVSYKGLQWCSKELVLAGRPAKLSSPQQNQKKKKKLQRGGSFHPCDVCSHSALHEHSWSFWARQVRAAWPWFATSPWFCAVLLCCCFNSAIDVVCHLQGRAARLLSEHWTWMTHMQPRKERWVRNGR